MSITKEYELESADEDNVMFSICTYIADNDDALNLVEGERVYVIGKLPAIAFTILKRIRN